MFKVLITTYPFADKSRKPLDTLESCGINYDLNPMERKLQENELAELVTGYDALIAGTELISEKVMARADRLKLISRVGVGLDGVDLHAAKRRGISVSYTPDAPSPAVSELTVGLMLSLLRSIQLSNALMHQGKWYRFFGRRISEVDIGIIGVGRIGRGVIQRLAGFGVRRIMVNDIRNDIPHNIAGVSLEFRDKDTIFRTADVISLHVPLTKQTENMIQRDQLISMKSDAFIINTARGGIIDEQQLIEVMNSGHLGGAALDVFEHEPYAGSLAIIDRCILTAHMGSMSIDCRTRMEVEATEEVRRFFKGLPMRNPVPKEEYEMQDTGSRE